MKLCTPALLLAACASTGEPTTGPAGLVAPAAAAPASTPPPAAAPEAAEALPGPRRVVAVGDLHGDLDNALATLQMAGITDAAGAWAGGDATLVQTGDVLDRGPDGKAIIELLERLEGEAPAAGGRVVALVGNHEVMNLMGDWRYVTPDDIAVFGSKEARQAALAPMGPLGHRLLTLDAVAMVNDVVFAHGGVSARFAPEGVKALSQRVRAGVLGAGPADVLGEEGPLWYRGYLQNDEPLACAELATALAALHARRMVVGHTTQRSGQIAARCGGALLGIDTGIADHYGAHLAALEITDGDARAIYPSGPSDLPDPPRP